MTTREQLVERVADKIREWDLRDWPVVVAHVVLDDVLPQVTTVEELEALPVGSKLLSVMGEVVEIQTHFVIDRAYHGSDGISLGYASKAMERWATLGPLTVVWQP